MARTQGSNSRNERRINRIGTLGSAGGIDPTKADGPGTRASGLGAKEWAAKSIVESGTLNPKPCERCAVTATTPKSPGPTCKSLT